MYSLSLSTSLCSQSKHQKRIAPETKEGLLLLKALGAASVALNIQDSFFSLYLRLCYITVKQKQFYKVESGGRAAGGLKLLRG